MLKITVKKKYTNIRTHTQSTYIFVLLKEVLKIDFFTAIFLCFDLIMSFVVDA